MIINLDKLKDGLKNVKSIVGKLPEPEIDYSDVINGSKDSMGGIMYKDRKLEYLIESKYRFPLWLGEELDVSKNAVMQSVDISWGEEGLWCI